MIARDQGKENTSLAHSRLNTVQNTATLANSYEALWTVFYFYRIFTYNWYLVHSKGSKEDPTENKFF